MKKDVLLKTNVFICAVIIMGFVLTSFISYYSNNGIFQQDIEHISFLTSEGIYHQIDSIFTKPINISLTMAGDSLLKTFLMEEAKRGDDEAYIETMRCYLLSYQEQYHYDSVFLVSTGTNRYYHFDKGIDRVLTEDNPENIWYYDFLEDPKEYSLNIDNDEVQSADNMINIFINCKIYSPTGEVIGVVGVGFGVDTLQEMFKNYEETFQLRAYLVDGNGSIEISTSKTGYDQEELFEDCAYAEYKEEILSDKKNTQAFWYASGHEKGYLVTKYIPNMKWHLIIENDTSVLETSLNRQFVVEIAVILFVIGAVLFVITRIIRKYNEQIVKLTVEAEKVHRTVFQTETEKMYEDIYEIDITHNRAASEATQSYFESLGVSGKTPFEKALHSIARQQIKEEYREGYIHTFSPDHVMQAYEEGKESLCYEFMMTNDNGATYYWTRITARIFFWEEDRSVRMLTYRQNIDEEKQRESRMAEKMQQDSLSGLYNKAATQELICKLLATDGKMSYAFFILDMDHFKTVNDTCGHAMGDLVITDFASKLQQQFRETDIVGRIGGDEFVVFIPVVSREWVEQKAEELTQALRYRFTAGGKGCDISASIGIALTPEAGIDFETLYQNADSALYQTKKKERRGYTVYSASGSVSGKINQNQP